MAPSETCFSGTGPRPSSLRTWSRWPRRKDALLGREERTANEKAWISVQVCTYQLPSKYRDKTVEELKAAVSGLFELESWKRFAEQNFKTLPRYARDQCLEAKRFFAEKEVETGILE